MARSTLFILSLALLVVCLLLLPQEGALSTTFASDGANQEDDNSRIVLNRVVSGGGVRTPLPNIDEIKERLKPRERIGMPSLPGQPIATEVVDHQPQPTSENIQPQLPNATPTPLPSPTVENAVRNVATPRQQLDSSIGCEQLGKFLPDPVPPPDPYVRTVQFGVNATEGITGFEWIFHDGTTSTDPNPQKTYPPGGPYKVTLICYGPEGTEPIVIEGEVWVEESDYQVTVVPTGTAPNTPQPTNTPGPTNTHTPTRTPGGPTDTPSPTSEPSATNTPTQTSSPGPSPTPTYTFTPSDTPEPQPFCGGITYFSDPAAPANEIGFKLTSSEGVERVRWTITQVGVIASTEPPHFAVGPFTFKEPGEVVISAAAIVRRPRRIIDCGEIVIQVERERGGGIELGEATLILTATPTTTPTAPPSTPVPPTSVPPTVPPSTPVPTDVPASGQGEVSISIGGETCPDWFIYHTERTSDLEIFRYGSLPDQPNAPDNLSQGVGAQDAMPSLSPDRRWMVFVSDRDGNPNLYLARTDGSEQRQLTTNPEAELDPAWGGAGRYIVFETNRAGNWDLWLYDVVGGAFYQMTFDTSNEMNAAWSPNGTHIMFSSDREGMWQLYELTINTREVRRLSDGSGNDSGAAYSNDGSQIAFVSERLGYPAVFTMRSDGGEVRAISAENGSARLPVWSPNDELLAYVSDLDGDDDIYVYEFATEKTRKLTANDTTETAPTWRCSSHQLTFMSDADGNHNLYNASAVPIDAPAIDVRTVAGKLTDFATFDGYPEDEPREENASLDIKFGRAQSLVSVQTD